MQKDHIHLVDGEIVEAEVNGRSLDGQSGHSYLFAPGHSMLASFLEGREIKVIRRPDGEWDEKPEQK